MRPSHHTGKPAPPPGIVRRYDLADAPQAHRDLASRRTTGKLLLLP